MNQVTVTDRKRGSSGIRFGVASQITFMGPLQPDEMDWRVAQPADNVDSRKPPNSQHTRAGRFFSAIETLDGRVLKFCTELYTSPEGCHGSGPRARLYLVRRYDKQEGIMGE